MYIATYILNDYIVNQTIILYYYHYNHDEQQQSFSWWYYLFINVTKRSCDLGRVGTVHSILVLSLSCTFTFHLYLSFRPYLFNSFTFYIFTTAQPILLSDSFRRFRRFHLDVRLVNNFLLLTKFEVRAGMYRPIYFALNWEKEDPYHILQTKR